jgi:hypothetical protein
MTINRNNFEAYLLDYLEGNLDPLLTADLMAFLAENPEFEKYIPDYDSALTLTDILPFTQKNHLKKEFSDIPQITQANFDEFCIADCEGLLLERDLTRLRDYISRYPEKQRDLDLYRRIKLQPDTSLKFSRRDLLKNNRRPARLRYLYFVVGMAAAFALLFLLVFLRKPDRPVYTETPPVNSERIEKTVEQPYVLSAAHDNHQSAISAPVSERRSKTSAAPMPATVPAETLKPDHSGSAPALLTPISCKQVLASVQPPPVSDHLKPAAGINQNQKQIRTYTSESFADTRLGSLLSRLDFWKTAETAITGFNYLTESMVSIDRTTDEKGKLTSFLIQSESYTIKEKIK